MRRILSRFCLAGTLAVLVLVAACSPSQSTAPSIPPGGPSVTSPSAAPTLDASASLDALYQEAEAVLRAEFAEEEKLMVAGGAEKLPPIFGQYLTGDHYQVIEALFRDLHARGWHSEEGHTASITAIQPARDESPEDSIAALRYCVDSTNAPLLDPQGQVVMDGGIDLYVIYFRRDGGQLKMFQGDSQAVTACPI